MFAIYDTTGRRFRDTLETLHRVRAIQGKTRMQLRPDLPDGETQTDPGATADGSGESLLSAKALQAYREMLQVNRREPIYHAYQLMSHPVSTVRMTMDIPAARRYFQEQGFQQMPVISAQQRIVGMLSVENLLQLVVNHGGQLDHLHGKCAADAMSSEVITADPVSDIRRIAQVMQDYRLHCVPIVDELDALLGIVSRSDILRAVTNDPPLNIWS